MYKKTLVFKDENHFEKIMRRFQDDTSLDLKDFEKDVDVCFKKLVAVNRDLKKLLSKYGKDNYMKNKLKTSLSMLEKLLIYIQ